MMLHQVLQEEPRPPRRLNDRIPRDLENICLKAMSKEPERRYRAAAELAEDLRRYLDGEPVRARPAGFFGRASLWCRRPERIRDAGAFTIFLGAVLTAWNALGAAYLALGLHKKMDRPYEGALMLIVEVLVFYLPTAWVGLATLRGRLLAVWVGCVFSLILTAILLAYVLGFTWVLADMPAKFDLTIPLFHFLLVLAGITLFLYVAALIAWYSNRNTMRWQRVRLSSLTNQSG